MEIYIANNAGFCFGVKRAVKLAEKTLNENQNNEKVYSYGELIHNPQVVEKFNKNGLKVIDDFEKEEQGTIVLRSHGIHPNIKKKMVDGNLWIFVLLQMPKNKIFRSSLKYFISKELKK